MNIFEKTIREGGIHSESDLKKLFRTLAKKTHPDAGIAGAAQVRGASVNTETVITPGSAESLDAHFINLKNDFDSARILLREFNKAKKKTKNTGMDIPDAQVLSREECIDIFIDLLASNFPVDIGVRNKNKLYGKRIAKLNETLSRMGDGFTDLFLRFETEMYALRGKTTISNQPFAVVKSYLYRFLDFTLFPGINNRNYLSIGYDQVYAIFKSRDMNNAVVFLNWLVGDIIGKEKLKA